jgi:hypothetical protein
MHVEGALIDIVQIGILREQQAAFQRSRGFGEEVSERGMPRVAVRRWPP